VRPFRFRLGRLRKVRRLQEEQERERWLEAELARREAEAAEQQARAALHAAEEDLRARQAADALGVLEVLQAQDALERVNVVLRGARERARTAAYQAERMRAPWEERRKEVRGLERLEERAREVWRREELRRETMEMDEVARRRARTLPIVMNASQAPEKHPSCPIRGNSGPNAAHGANPTPDPQAGLQAGRSKTGERS